MRAWGDQMWQRAGASGGRFGIICRISISFQVARIGNVRLTGIGLLPPQNRPTVIAAGIYMHTYWAYNIDWDFHSTDCYAFDFDRISQNWYSYNSMGFGLCGTTQLQ